MPLWSGSSQNHPTVDYFEISDREQLLATYGAAISQLDALVASLDGEALHLQPAIDVGNGDMEKSVAILGDAAANPAIWGSTHAPPSWK